MGEHSTWQSTWTYIPWMTRMFNVAFRDEAHHCKGLGEFGTAKDQPTPRNRIPGSWICYGPQNQLVKGFQGC